MLSAYRAWNSKLKKLYSVLRLQLAMELSPEQYRQMNRTFSCSFIAWGNKAVVMWSRLLGKINLKPITLKKQKQNKTDHSLRPGVYLIISTDPYITTVVSQNDYTEMKNWFRPIIHLYLDLSCVYTAEFMYFLNLCIL